MEPFRKTEIHALAMNQILREGFVEQAGLNSTSRSRPTMNSLAKRCQPAEPLKMGIANRDGIAARKEGSAPKSRIGRFQAKRMKAVVEKQSKGKPLQQHEGRWRLTRNFSLWSEVASEKFRAGEGEQACGSQLGKGEEF